MKISIKLYPDEFEYVIYEVFEKAAFHSSRPEKLDIWAISKDWREQAKKQGWTSSVASTESERREIDNGQIEQKV